MADEFDDGYQNKGDETLIPLNINKKSEIQTAVALKDRTLERQLPQVVAAGRGKIAEKILQLAFENGIKVREDSALVEILATIELDSPIPSEAFGAVAEILSYIYRANGQPNPFDVVLQDVMGEGKDDPENE
jgi:flagellar biosynthesis protein